MHIPEKRLFRNTKDIRKLPPKRCPILSIDCNFLYSAFWNEGLSDNENAFLANNPCSGLTKNHGFPIQSPIFCVDGKHPLNGLIFFLVWNLPKTLRIIQVDNKDFPITLFSPRTLGILSIPACKPKGNQRIPREIHQASCCTEMLQFGKKLQIPNLAALLYPKT